MLRPTGTDDDARKLHVFATTRPRAVPGVCHLALRGDGAAVDNRERAVGPERWPGAAALRSTTRQRGRARDALTKAAEIIEFYTSVMGEAPYPSLTLAVSRANVPGGHTPGVLRILNQPLPTSPFMWRDDPAAFDNYPDFFLAHELAHQWWGQAVGWKNYHEQWLSEGFAQYFAALYAERPARRRGVRRDHPRRWADGP